MIVHLRLKGDTHFKALVSREISTKLVRLKEITIKDFGKNFLSKYCCCISKSFQRTGINYEFLKNTFLRQNFVAAFQNLFKHQL